MNRFPHVREPNEPSIGLESGRGRPGPRRVALAAVFFVSVAVAVVGSPAGPALARSRGTGVHGLPSGAPPAATSPEPSLPKPKGWPFPEAFPRTSGTGRLASGASFWTDFLYDDHGAIGGVAGYVQEGKVANLAPPRGSYTYPSGPARGNGADIFRAAVGLKGGFTYWRVDWNTLVDPRVPIAEWALNTDDNPNTGSSTWAGGSGVHAPGIDRALLVSSRGAWLIRGASPQRVDIRSLGGSLTVDARARSFIVRIPTEALPVQGSWRIRLVAGLADPAGTGFASVPISRGAAPGEPAVYNVTFRSFRQEPVVAYPPGVPASAFGPDRPVAEFANFWMEYGQASALSKDDITPFSLVVNWQRLAQRTSTAEPLPTGYTNRWYVSRLNLGQGVAENTGDPASGDLKPNFLGRVQPYAVYVPSHYDPRRPTPPTWILHSLGQIHNQYGGVAPDQIKAECEDRNSICATTLGFGPDGWYLDEAEVDFWQVWRALADAYNLDPNRTVISGYSMGGWATNWLASRYPDLFAKAMELAGPSVCGLRVYGPIEGAASSSDPHCAADGDVLPLLANDRWVPFIMVHGVADELVPIPGALEELQTLDGLGYRYYAQIYPAEDHMAFSVQNGWSTESAQIGSPTRMINPAHITYAWYPDLDNPAWGIGPTGVYWIRSLVARRSGPGVLARLEAMSQARPDPIVTVVRHMSATVPGSPTPAIVRELTWKYGATPEARPALRLTLHDVAALAVDTRRAGLRDGTIAITTDGPTTLRLLQLPPGSTITEGSTSIRANDEGVAVVSVASGRTMLFVG